MKVEAAIRQHLANVGAGAGVGRVSRSIQNAVRAAVAAGRHHEQLRGAGLAARCGSGVGRGGAGESPARHWGEVRLSGRKRDGAMRESTERSESACHRQVAATVRTRAGKPGTGSATGSRGRALPNNHSSVGRAHRHAQQGSKPEQSGCPWSTAAGPVRARAKATRAAAGAAIAAGHGGGLRRAKSACHRRAWRQR